MTSLHMTSIMCLTVIFMPELYLFLRYTRCKTWLIFNPPDLNCHSNSNLMVTRWQRTVSGGLWVLDDVTDNTWFRHYTLQLLTILAKQEREGTWTERSLPQTMTSDPSSPNLKKKKMLPSCEYVAPPSVWQKHRQRKTWNLQVDDYNKCRDF